MRSFGAAANSSQSLFARRVADKMHTMGCGFVTWAVPEKMWAYWNIKTASGVRLPFREIGSLCVSHPSFVQNHCWNHFCRFEGGMPPGCQLGCEYNCSEV